MIGRPGLIALMLVAGVLPAAQVDEIKRETEREQQIARLVSVTAWSWSKAHDVLTEAKCLGIAVEELIVEAGQRGPDAALELVTRTRAAAAMAEPVATSPPPAHLEPSHHPYRVGDRLARRLGDRR